MKIKNISLILLAGLSVILNTSCRFEEDEYFDQSASLRVTATNTELKSRLVSQSSDGKYGWVIQYFVAGTDDADFEGFNLFGRFDESGKVTLASDHRFLRNGNAGKYTEASSVYEVTSEEGTVLSFITWNDILSVFADPVDPSQAPSTIVDDGVGMNGDYNLVLHSMTDDAITFRGQRHQAEVRFIKCDRPWQDYIATVNDTKKYISNKSLTSYYVTDGSNTRYFTDMNTGIMTYGERIVDPLDAKTVSCLFTLNGVRLNNITSLGDNTFQEFTLDKANGKLISEDGKTQIIPCWDLYVTNGPADWRIDPEKFTAEQAELFQKMGIEVKKANSAYELDSIAIGRIQETVDGEKVDFTGLIAYVHGPARMGRIPVYKPYIDMNIDRPEFGQILFSKSSLDRITPNMEPYKNTELKSLCEQFAATLYSTYTIKPNDYFRPTFADLTPISEGIPVKLRLRSITD